MRKKRNPATVKIANDIITAYKPKSVEEMQEVILNGEMENYLGHGEIQNPKSQLKIAATVILTKSSKPRWSRPKF